MEYYIEAFKKYGDFEGRTSRKAFWMFVLFNFLAGILVGILDFIFALTYSHQGFLSDVYNLAIILPTISISVRRMHDSDHSGWWILFPFVNLFFAVTKGTPGPNKYDPVIPIPSVDEIPSPPL